MVNSWWLDPVYFIAKVDTVYVCVCARARACVCVCMFPHASLSAYPFIHARMHTHINQTYKRYVL